MKVVVANGGRYDEVWSAPVLVGTDADLPKLEAFIEEQKRETDALLARCTAFHAELAEYNKLNPKPELGQMHETVQGRAARRKILSLQDEWRKAYREKYAELQIKHDLVGKDYPDNLSWEIVDCPAVS